jgi:arginine utilization regulatory protein
MHHLPRHFLPPDFTLLTEEFTDPHLDGPNDVEKLPELNGAESRGPELNEPQLNSMPQSLLRRQKTREKELINLALVESAGNVSRAARKLNISRQLLHYKMKKYGLQRSNYLSSELQN